MNRTRVLIIAAATASLVGFAPASLYAQASSTDKPVPAEKNPPGDIPDNQVFIEYGRSSRQLLRMSKRLSKSPSMASTQRAI
jgi:hypothetical protein